MLKLQRPAKTSRTSSKPPSTDRKERREQSRPGGAKPGHEGHSRVVADEPDAIIDHRPTACPACGLALGLDLPAETLSVHEQVELPEVKPIVEQYRRLAVTCPGCLARVPAPRPAEAAITPFGPRLHATAVYLKTFQALFYERLQRALSDLFGLTLSQGGLTNMLRRAEARFAAGREAALSVLRPAAVVALDETSVRIEGSNGVPLGVPSRGRCGASRCLNTGRLRGPRNHGRTPAGGVAVGPLCRPAGSRRSPADLPGPPCPRCRLRRRGRRRPGRVAPQAVARRRPGAGPARHRPGRLDGAQPTPRGADGSPPTSRCSAKPLQDLRHAPATRQRAFCWML